LTIHSSELSAPYSIEDLQIQVEPPACLYCHWYKRKDPLKGFCVPNLKIVYAWEICRYYKEAVKHE